MSGDERERAAAPVGAGLDERVLSTLQGLRGRIAFNGLRRALRAHPESLSRALRRLEREGLVERAAGGYRAIAAPEEPRPASTELRTLASVDLPPGLSAELVLGRLAGRWFGSLRWVGLVERPSGRLLAWTGRDGAGYVLLGIDRGVLKVFLPREFESGDPMDSEDVAYELLAHAIEALRFSGGTAAPSVALFAAERVLVPGLRLEN